MQPPNELVRADDSAQVRWRTHLEESSEMQFRIIRSEVAKLHKNILKSDMMTCMWCSGKACKLDSVQLLCHPQRRPQTAAYDERSLAPPHVICFSCIAHLIEQQNHFLQRQIALEQRMSEDTMASEGLMLSPIHILPCPLCKCPNVLTVRTSFSEGLSRERIEASGVVTQYCVHAGATKVLSDNFTVEEVYQNERRPIFGSFTARNLLSLDWRGHFSNVGGSAVERSIEPKPNKAWIWLETHAPDVTLPNSGVGGWQYAHLFWPSDPLEYTNEVSLLHFVRRRRLLHTRMRLNADVKEQLRTITAELEPTTLTAEDSEDDSPLAIWLQ